MMRNCIKRSISLVLLFLVVAFFYGCNSKLRSVRDVKTSFAIVVDSLTLKNANSAIIAYKNMLENEGLKVHVLSIGLENPSQIREELFHYYTSQPKLEGVVFIGDVPIPHITNAQHLATAYKRDEHRYPLHISAIPSDRYYDDFDLKFDFIEKDSVRPLNYYYNLSVNSPQYLKSDIYSGRIKPSIKDGEDKYQLISEYLGKVVSIRNSTEIDFLMSFTGHGYNSEALTAWAGEKIALREQFPSLYTPKGRVEFLDFRMDEFMKPFLLDRFQDPDLDIALLHEHGSPELQLINGIPDVSSVQASIDNVKWYLRSKLRSAARRGRDIEEAKRYYVNWLDVPEKWFNNTFDQEVVDQDSIYNYNMDIYADDADKIAPEVKFIMFDACFNGSFQLDRYLAGEYVFGKGSTMVAHANTVNALQDKWPNEMLGLLKLGVRVGNWAKQINSIETHLIGDPTYYFKTNQELDYNKLIALASAKPELWSDIFEMDDPDLKCLAISNLFHSEDPSFSSRLKELYFSSSDFVVRMEILTQLYKYNDENFKEVLKAAVNDPYELIRRYAATMIGNCGDDDLIEPLLSLMFDDKYSKRVRSNAYNSFNFMNPDALTQVLPEIAQKYSYAINSSTLRDDLMKKASTGKNKINEYYKIVVSDSAEMKYRLLEIRTLRNYYYHYVVPDYLSLVEDPAFDNELRKRLIEALGWFTHSVHRGDIVEACNGIIADESFTEEIKEEAQRTINRIEAYQ